MRRLGKPGLSESAAGLSSLSLISGPALELQVRRCIVGRRADNSCNARKQTYLAVLMVRGIPYILCATGRDQQPPREYVNSRQTWNPAPQLRVVFNVVHPVDMKIG